MTGTVLLVDDDPITLHAYAEIVGSLEGLQVLTATSGQEGLAAARAHRPDLILSDLRMEDMDGVAFCRAVRTDPSLEGGLFVLVTGVQDAPTELSTQTGIDDIVIKPVTAPELLAKVRAMLRLKHLHDQLRADKLELERLNGLVEQRFDQLMSLLVHLIDLRVPGAATRGSDTARLAEQLAERFEIPRLLHRDLQIAARLQEIGKVVLASELGDAEREDVIDGDRWRYAIAARDLLQQTEGLGDAAELIGAAFENWDGTGHPGRLRQGQIPLRARILRVLIDYQGALESGAADSGAAAVELLTAQSGRRYDPLVVAYLSALVRAANEGPGLPERARVQVERLEEGMVLADDLYTSSGIKLLAAGAQLTESSLEAIQRRHRSDPIVHGAWVRRPLPAPG